MGEDYASGQYACQAYAPPSLVLMRFAHENLPMDERRALGRAIAQLREAAGLTQPQLAEAAGLGQSAISRIESGSQGTTDKSMAGIAKALRARVSQIYELAESLQDSADIPSKRVDGRRKPAKKQPTNVDHDIDALRESIGAIAIALTSLRQADGVKMLEELNGVDPKYLEKEGSVVALIGAVEDALQEAKVHKRARSRASA